MLPMEPGEEAKDGLSVLSVGSAPAPAAERFV